jgi:hypothetical protein
VTAFEREDDAADLRWLVRRLGAHSTRARARGDEHAADQIRVACTRLQEAIDGPAAKLHPWRANRAAKATP